MQIGGYQLPVKLINRSLKGGMGRGVCGGDNGRRRGCSYRRRLRQTANLRDELTAIEPGPFAHIFARDGGSKSRHLARGGPIDQHITIAIGALAVGISIGGLRDVFVGQKHRKQSLLDGVDFLGVDHAILNLLLELSNGHRSFIQIVCDPLCNLAARQVPIALRALQNCLLPAL